MQIAGNHIEEGFPYGKPSFFVAICVKCDEFGIDCIVPKEVE